MKKFAAFDIDGTLIRWQLYHAIADALAKKGYIRHSEFDAIRDARMDWKNRKHSEAFKSYELGLVKLYDQVLTSLKVEHFNEAAKEVFEEYKDQVYTYTRELIKELKEKDYMLFAISGSQAAVVEKIARHYGFDDFSGVVYPSKNGVFTGEKKLTVGKKHEIIKDLAKKHRVTFKESVAVGDSAGDISMLEMVERPVAFNPERTLFNIAVDKGWKVVVERKNMVYELENRDGKYELVKTNA